MPVNKDIVQILRRVEQQGFTINRNPKTNHYRVKSPSGGAVTVPSTPRNGCRSFQNIRAKLRKIGAEL